MTPRTAIAAVLITWTGASSAQESILTSDMLEPGGNGMLDAKGFELPDLSNGPILRPGRTDNAARLLRLLTIEGDANGHRGVVYDNRDRGHSTLRQQAYPSLARLSYGAGMERSDIGLASRIRLPAIVIGNASMAVTSGPRPRSLPRSAMTSKGDARRLYSLYINNHLYLYPEHRDHDEVDRFPANWPLTVTSQGSSGSDRPFLNALLMSIAAMPQATVKFLSENGLVAPTLQMLLRRNLQGVNTSEDYFTAVAHPTVFDGSQLRAERMISLAASLRPEAIAPMPRLEVLEEDFGSSAGLAGRDERLFDTPVAISRLWRGVEGRKYMRVSAAKTRDPLGREMKFRWVLLRGDPERIKVTLSQDTTTADIQIDWHDPFTVRNTDRERLTSRVDIGVFVDVGGEVSSPAFVSVEFPIHQRRDYDLDASGAPRLQSVDYDASSRRAAYDPVLYWTAPWTDVAIRNDTEELVAWDRNGRIVNLDIGASAYSVVGTDGSLPRLEEASSP